MTNPRSHESPTARHADFLVGGAVGAVLAAGPAPTDRQRASLALPDALLVELLSGGVDLRSLAQRWISWRRTDGYEIDPPLAAALDHLEQFDAPPDSLPSTSLWPVVVALPAALARESRRSMLSGAFHVARLVDPDPESGLLAIAAVVAGATLLDGGTDVIPEVLAALRSNDAPHTMLESVIALARNPSARPELPGPTASSLTAVCWILWQVQYQRAALVAADLAELRSVAPSAVVGAVLGTLLGARDGSRWVDAAVETPEIARRKALASTI